MEEEDLPSTAYVKKEVLAIMDRPTKKRKNELPTTSKVNGSATKAHGKNDDFAIGEQDSEDEDGFALPGKKRGGKATEQTPKKKQAVSRYCHSKLRNKAIYVPAIMLRAWNFLSRGLKTGVMVLALSMPIYVVKPGKTPLLCPCTASGL